MGNKRQHPGLATAVVGVPIEDLNVRSSFTITTRPMIANGYPQGCPCGNCYMTEKGPDVVLNLKVVRPGCGAPRN